MVLVTRQPWYLNVNNASPRWMRLHRVKRNTIGTINMIAVGGKGFSVCEGYISGRLEGARCGRILATGVKVKGIV